MDHYEINGCFFYSNPCLHAVGNRPILGSLRFQKLLHWEDFWKTMGVYLTHELTVHVQCPMQALIRN